MGILGAMSQENVQLVMTGYDAAERQDGGAALELLGENAVWDMTGFGMPDLARVYRGADEILGFWANWLAAWEKIESTTVEPEDHGDHVVVRVEQRNVGRASGVAVNFQYWQTFTVRDGKIAASTMAETRAAALEAVGLRE